MINGYGLVILYSYTGSVLIIFQCTALSSEPWKWVCTNVITIQSLSFNSLWKDKSTHPFLRMSERIVLVATTLTCTCMPCTHLPTAVLIGPSADQ